MKKVLFVTVCSLAFALPAAAQTPQCTVPNTLTNGQVADATEVMDNFNAVATCVEDARDDTVTHDGTPATGEIAVFSSPTGVTGGDLTGDVTTSGGTATTLSPSGVTAGSYVNPTITVDGKGRITSASNGGGGGGGAFAYQAAPVDVPAVANFTWLNQGSAVAIDDTLGVRFDTDIDGELHGLMQPAPTSTSYDLYMRVEQIAGRNNVSSSFYSYPTILLRNSQSGRILHVYLGRGRSSRDYFWTAGIQRWSSVTSYVSEAINVNYLQDYTKWIRVAVTASTVTVYVSPNGFNWVEVGTENLSSFLNASGGTLDEVGFGLRAGSATFSTAFFQQFGTNAP
ncbi:MAG: hypothetical protein AAGA34_05945 [Pseudomonadota bacterium]